MSSGWGIVFLLERADILGIDADADELYASVLKLRPTFENPGSLCGRRAPCGPEIHHHHLATPLFERLPCPREIRPSASAKDFSPAADSI